MMVPFNGNLEGFVVASCNKCNLGKKGDKKKLEGTEYRIFPDYTVTLKDSNKSITAWAKKKNKPVKITIIATSKWQYNNCLLYTSPSPRDT